MNFEPEIFSLLICFSLQGPRPSALVIEKTLDNSRTWAPALYLATDCQKAFPGVPTTTPLTLDQTYCYTLPPTGANPYQDHTVSTNHPLWQNICFSMSSEVIILAICIIITLKNQQLTDLQCFWIFSTHFSTSIEAYSDISSEMSSPHEPHVPPENKHFGCIENKIRANSVSASPQILHIYDAACMCYFHHQYTVW